MEIKELRDEKNPIYGYKGFNSDLQGAFNFQYTIGNTYTKTSSKEKGFYFSEEPFNVFKHYAPCNEKTPNRYCKVKCYGEIKTSLRYNESTCDTLHVGDELSLKEFIEEGIAYLYKKSIKYDNTKDKLTREKAYQTIDTNTKNSSISINIGDCSIASNTAETSAAHNEGYYAISASTGNYSVASSAGLFSISCNSGNYSCAYNDNKYSIAAITGEYSAAVTMADYSVAVSINKHTYSYTVGENCVAITTRDNSNAYSEGNNSLSLATGYNSKAISIGEESIAITIHNKSESSVRTANSIAMALGEESKAKGVLNSWLILIEKSKWKPGEKTIIKTLKAFKVDGIKVKADTYYTLKNGKLKEVL